MKYLRNGLMHVIRAMNFRLSVALMIGLHAVNYAEATDLTGIYSSALTSGYLSVHQSGNTLIGISIDEMNYYNYQLILGNGQRFAPGKLMIWGYGVGQLSDSGTSASISGPASTGACTATYKMTITGATTFSLALESYVQSSSGATQGINCNAIGTNIQSAVQAIGGSIPFTKIF